MGITVNSFVEKVLYTRKFLSNKNVNINRSSFFFIILYIIQQALLSFYNSVLKFFSSIIVNNNHFNLIEIEKFKRGLPILKQFSELQKVIFSLMIFYNLETYVEYYRSPQL